MTDEVLKVNDLTVRFYTYSGVVKALEGVNFEVREGETFAIVGETGCGKSVTALSTMLLTPSPGEIVDGEVLFKRDSGYTDLTKLDEDQMREIRGNEISMIFQEPSDALNPVYDVGEQISESFLSHRKDELVKDKISEVEEDIDQSEDGGGRWLNTKLSLYKSMLDEDSNLSNFASKVPLLNSYEDEIEDYARKKTKEILEDVGIPDPEGVADKYPHEMSGGMNQRAVISMALACKPKLLIADEPTSNLDVSIQKRILNILKNLKDEYNLSILYITHNLGLVAQTCDRVGVMYAGRIVESAPVKELFENPEHPYTKLLLKALPGSEKDELKSVEGSVPDLISPPSGCRFHPRCPVASEECEKRAPDMVEVGEDHKVACHIGEDNDEK